MEMVQICMKVDKLTYLLNAKEYDESSRLLEVDIHQDMNTPSLFINYYAYPAERTRLDEQIIDTVFSGITGFQIEKYFPYVLTINGKHYVRVTC